MTVAAESAGNVIALPLVDFARPLAAADAIVDERFDLGRLRTLHYWQGEFHIFTGSHYELMPLPDLRQMLYRIGARASTAPVRKTAVDNVVDALRAVCNLSHRDVAAAPAWFPQAPDDPDPRAVIPVRNGLLRIADQRLMPATPRLFAPYCLPLDWRPDPPQPRAWLAFLESLWSDDPQAVDCLQEWLGYLLTADTAQQKALLIVGPKRSGKGTIGRVIVRLLGTGNVAAPSLASLGAPFGLQGLIGKTCALISDARLGGRADVAAVAENLLRITGEDSISIDRKFMPAFTARLLTRLVILGNELPTFRDASSALPSRFVILRTTRSFYGREDHALDARLADELPGILAWSLAGLRRLRERGRFVQPQSVTDALQMFEDLASPIGAFLRDHAILEAGAIVPVRRLFSEWQAWCTEHGREHAGTEQAFGRDLAAAAPAVRVTQRRVNGERARFYIGLRLRNPDDPQTEDDGDELL